MPLKDSLRLSMNKVAHVWQSRTPNIHLILLIRIWLQLCCNSSSLMLHCPTYEPFHVSHDRFSDIVLNRYSSICLMLRYVIEASVWCLLVKTAWKNIEPFVFYSSCTESTIKALKSRFHERRFSALEKFSKTSTCWAEILCTLMLDKVLHFTSILLLTGKAIGILSIRRFEKKWTFREVFTACIFRLESDERPEILNTSTYCCYLSVK